MNKDFSQYHRLIEQFRGKVLRADFEARFSAITSKIPKSESFLLKMELKRLAALCTRLIDLRGLVDGECRAYEHEGRVHFLDDVAIKVFENSHKAYGGYTIGVYESAKNTENNFKVIYQREKQAIKESSYSTLETPTAVLEKIQYPAKFYQFGLTPDRTEERMNFAIAVELTSPGKPSIQVVSSDLSIGGCKLRLNANEKLVVENNVELRFLGLEEEYNFGNNVSYIYQIKNIQNIDNFQLIGLERVYDEPTKKDGFSEFLKGFIQGNKRRYKINLDHTINALKIRSIEHFTLPKVSELPVYIEDNNGHILPRYALTCTNNRKVYNYWKDESNKSTLDFLISNKRLQRLMKAHEEGESLLVYSFIHTNEGKSFFYTVDNIQLDNDIQFASKLLGLMSDKPSFRVTQLSFIMTNDSLADFPFAVSDNLQLKDQHLNLSASEDVKKALNKLPYIVVANDITNKSMVNNYQLGNYENINISKLKAFGHKRKIESLFIDEVGIRYKNQRQEVRFKYKTPVVVELPRIDLEGFSHDFSMSGLKIELESPSLLSKGEVVNLHFPHLQKITSTFHLKNLPYEIVAINAEKTIINCHIYVEKHQHIGRNFFKLLINKNKEKLQPDVHTLLTPGLGKALRNIYMASLDIPSLIIQSSGSRYKVEWLAGSHSDSDFLLQMKRLSDKEGFYNLYPVLGSGMMMNLLNQTIKNIKATDFPEKTVLYISINPNVENINKAVNIKLETELGNNKQKEFFIKNALKKGLFFSLQINISRTLEPDLEYLNPELSYISSYAIHRGKKIEQDIWSVVGMMQLCDITQEVFFRNKILLESEAYVI